MFGTVKDVNRVVESFSQFCRTFVGREPFFIINNATDVEAHFDFEITESNHRKLQNLANAYFDLTGVRINVYSRGYVVHNLVLKNL